MDKDKILDHTLKQLFEAAMSDNVITDEEFELIQEVEFHIDKYELALIDAKKDGVIDDDEVEHLSQLKDEILNQAHSIANADDVINEDEKILLLTLSNLIQNYFKGQERIE